MYTPWGTSQYSKSYCRGIVFYGTAGHGGLHVSKKLNQQIHEIWRSAEGWYEEDCAWAIVAITFPEVFPTNTEEAHRTAKNYFPHEYEHATGIRVLPEESYVLREEIFREETKDKYVVVSAWGDHDERVPTGYVGVHACRGGRLPNGFYPDDCGWFLVPKDEYKYTSGTSFVIDEAKHESWSKHP